MVLPCVKANILIRPRKPLEAKAAIHLGLLQLFPQIFYLSLQLLIFT